MEVVLKQIQEVRSATSKFEKRRLLRKFDSPVLRKLLFVAFSPTVVLGLGEIEVDRDALPVGPLPTLLEFLDFIRRVDTRETKGHQAAEEAYSLVHSADSVHRWILAGILTGTMPTPMFIATKQAFPDLIPTLNMQRAFTLDPEYLVFPGYARYSVGGAMSLGIVSRNGTRLFTSGGTNLTVFPHIEAALKKLPYGYYPGELQVPGIGAQGINKVLATTAASKAKFFISDFITEEEWGNPRTHAKQRFAALRTAFDNINTQTLVLVEHELVLRNSELQRIHTKYQALGYPATFFQATGAYIRTRGWHLQKLQ